MKEEYKIILDKVGKQRNWLPKFISYLHNHFINIISFDNLITSKLKNDKYYKITILIEEL